MDNSNLKTFDESSNSSTVSECNWTTLDSDLTSKEIKQLIASALPKSIAYQTNHDLNCRFFNDFGVHKLKQQLRKCIENEGCPVKYSVLCCEKTNIGSISKKNVSGQWFE